MTAASMLEWLESLDWRLAEALSLFGPQSLRSQVGHELGDCWPGPPIGCLAQFSEPVQLFNGVSRTLSVLSVVPCVRRSAYGGACMALSPLHASRPTLPRRSSA